MSPTDPLFTEADAEPTPAGTPPAKPNGANGADPSPDAVAAAETAALREEVAKSQQSISDLTNLVKQLTERDLNPPTPQEDPQPPATQDEILSELAADPEKTMRRLARAEAEDLVGSQISPQATLIIDTTHKMLSANQQQAIDSKFGPGTYKEVFEPKLADDLAQIRKTNPALLASQETLQRMVDGVMGRNMAALNEREAKFVTQGEEENQKTMAEIANSLPIAGIPRLANRETVADTPDAKLFFAEIEKATGEKIDPKEFAAVHAAGPTFSDYLSAVGKKEKE